MKVVHFADLHLDTPFAWAAPDVARRRRLRLQAALERVVQLALDEEADALLCAGDLYEHDRFRPDTGEFLRGQFERLGDTPVFVAPGNHDWYGPKSLYHAVAWPPNVHVFDTDALTPVELADGLTVWGAAHTRPRGTRGFLDSFAVDRAGVNLALFHGSESSALRFEASGKEAHAPFREDQLEAARLDYAFVGHFHVPRDTTRYSYPGNPEPLEFGETGERGALAAEVAGDGRVHVRRVGVAETVLHDVLVDVSGCASGHDVRSRVREHLEGLAGVARVTLHGELSPDADFRPDDLREITGVDGLDAVVTRVGTLTVGYDVDALAGQPTVEGQFVRRVRDADLDDDDRRRILVTGLRALHGRDDLEVM